MKDPAASRQEKCDKAAGKTTETLETPAGSALWWGRFNPRQSYRPIDRRMA
jgi:hypothetical protein